MKMKLFYLVIKQMCITFDDLYAVALVLIVTSTKKKNMGCAGLFVCRSVRPSDNVKSNERICAKLLPQVCHGPRNND